MKIVVFDLDETLGYFTQFGIFWDSLKKYVKTNKSISLTQNDFNEILDLYPEFIRPNIIHILNYLKQKKKNKCCYKMMIYTNNTGPREWAEYIVKYFENKIQFHLIDQIIAAFKINGNRVEICRTTSNKTHNDLIRCTKVSRDTEICFMDDNYYPDMVNNNIYYINIKPYYHDLTFDTIIKRIKTSKISERLELNNNSFEKEIMNHIKLYKYVVIEKDKEEYEIDKILGKYIISHLQKFFHQTGKNKTYKNRQQYKNKTRKNHN